MCGRASITVSEKALEVRLKASFADEYEGQYSPNYNMAPSHLVPVVTNADQDHIQMYRWGLIPFWAKDEKIGYKMINARIETIMQKSAFKNATKKRRCLVPLDGFYEWQKDGRKKTPYRIKMRDDSIFCAAGLWESWTSPGGEEVFSFTIITQAPNELMQPIHDRMPAILTPDQESLWLDDTVPPSELISLIKPYDSDLMMAYPVSGKVGNVRNNDASLIEPEAPPSPVQGSLFE